MGPALQYVFEGALGLATGLLLVSPVEWALHKYLLHAPKIRRRWYNRFASEVHTEGHHVAYLAPQHYYRDASNAHEKLAFPLYSAILILVVAAGIGLGLDRLWSLLPSTDPSFGTGDLAYVLGWVLAGAIGYVGYEVPHHYMHVLGPRRLEINRKLGDRLQEGRDGKLRLSKPLLDDICNEVEDRIDARVSRPFDEALLDRLGDQLAYNRDRGLAVTDRPLPEILQELTEVMTRLEDETRASLSPIGRLAHSMSRRTQWLFRGSNTAAGRYFTHIDHNHSVHHRLFSANYNVFMTWADRAFGTRTDCSREGLEQDKRTWLCPNSPEEPLLDNQALS